MIIDFHTHILPGIDDGSRDIDMTERMLEMEHEQSVSYIYATPHFYAHRRSIQSFLERREHAYGKVRELLERRPELPRVKTGAEVYYFSGIGRAEQLPELCVEGTDLLLLEMPFTQWTEDMYKDVKDIIDRRHLRIVLAHVERYVSLQKHWTTWDKIMDLPLTIQMNAGSFTAGILASRHAKHVAKFCMNTLMDYENCIIGTDCHNLKDRAPDLARARNEIEKKAGRARIAQMDAYTEELLGLR